MRYRNRAGALTALIGCAALVAATDAAASASRVKATKSPINVMATGFFSGATGSLPESPGAYKATAAAINASGGINGHPIRVTICNDQDSANVAQGCAEQAVSNHDVAVLSENARQSAAVLPTLLAHGIPYVGDDVETTADATDKNSFPIAAGTLDAGSGPGVVAAKNGCKKAAVVIDDFGTLTTELENGIAAGLKSQGGTDVANIEVSDSTADFTPSVAAAVAKGAQCIIGTVTEDSTTQLISAVKQSGNGMRFVTFGLSMPPLNTLGSLGNGVLIASQGRVPSDKTPGVVKAVKWIHKYSPGTAVTSDSIAAVGGMLLLKDGLAGITGSKYTAKALLKSMDHLKNASTNGLYPPYTTTGKPLKASEPREFDPTVITYKITASGQEVAVGGFTKLAGF